MGPRSLNYSEEKGGGQAKQNPAVERFEGAHHFPARSQIQICVAVAGHGVQRIQNRGLGVRQSPKQTVSAGPDNTLNSMENGGRKGCASNDEDGDSGGKA